MMAAMRCLIRGRVQGVFFRASTRHEARRLGLHGRALNLADGRVEVIACGDETALRALRDWLRHGPPLAHVEELECEWLDAIDCDAPFSIG